MYRSISSICESSLEREILFIRIPFTPFFDVQALLSMEHNAVADLIAEAHPAWNGQSLHITHYISYINL